MFPPVIGGGARFCRNAAASAPFDATSRNVRRAAAAQLVFFFVSTPRLWFGWHEQVNPLPVQSEMLGTARAASDALAACVLAALLHAILLPAAASLAVAFALPGLALLASADASRLQPQLLHGMALLVVSSVADARAARVVLSGNWLWSGVHKINPTFLTMPSIIIDPVFALAIGEGLTQQMRTQLRYLVSLGEAGAGAVLLSASLWPPPLLSRPMHYALVRASAAALAAMHMIIIARLLLLGWNLNVIRWNVECIFLLWHIFASRRQEGALDSSRDEHGGRAPHKRPAHPPTPSPHRAALVAALVLFVFAPALVLVGWLDPYLGNANYSSNVPTMDIELYVSGNFHDSWLGHVGTDATASDGRRVLATTYAELKFLTTGSRGYPAEWLLRRFADSLCERVRTGADPQLVNVCFRLSKPWVVAPSSLGYSKA